MSASPIAERMLRAYVRHVPMAAGKYRLVNALWRSVAGADYQREARLLHGDFAMTCNLDELIQRQFYYFGTYYLERHLLSVWQEQAILARTICDIGANAGIYSLAALAVSRTASVHAFEPTPEIAGRLRHTRERNGLGSLVVNEIALSDRTGEAQLVRFDGGGDNGGMNYIVRPEHIDPAQSVAMTTLDAYCQKAGIDRIDLVKIDVQGAEPQVLRGAAGLLARRAIGTIFMELNWAAPGRDCPASEAVALLEQNGFVFSPIDPSPQWQKAGEWLRGHADVMAQATGTTG